MFAMLTIYLVPLFLTLAQPHDAKPEGIFLIGNSLTWDTVPGRLAGRARWHVDCGVSLPWIHSHPEKPCVKDSSLWPLAMREGNFAFVSVQPHYGSTLTEDADAISAWMRLQPGAVFVIHSGWAFHAQRESEFLNCDPPLKMTHSPVYTRALMAELSRRHPGREIRQTLAQNILDQVASDIVKGTAPFKDISVSRARGTGSPNFGPLNGFTWTRFWPWRTPPRPTARCWRAFSPRNPTWIGPPSSHR